MIKTYKPLPIKPVSSELWAPVSFSDWSLGGDPMIETQFEYVSKLQAQLNRQTAQGGVLNYASTPTLADFGSVTINPGGSLIAVERDAVNNNKQVIKSTNSDTEINIIADSARSELINRQYTSLEITSILRNGIDQAYPIVLTYMRALIYNTETLVKPALHIKSMFSLLNSLKNFNNAASIRVGQILNKLSQRKFVKPYNEYLALLSTTPLHRSTVMTLSQFFTIEKLNDAFNTSYDYVKVKHPAKAYDWANIASALTVTAANGATGSAVDLLLKIDKHDPEYFYNRRYLLDMIKMVNTESTDQQGFDQMLKDFDSIIIPKLMDLCINATSSIATLPIIFSPFYSALPFLGDYIDTSIFSTTDFENMELPIRKSSFYARGNTLAGIAVQNTGNTLYPTLSLTAPLHYGKLDPINTYNSNGLLYLRVPEWSGKKPSSISDFDYVPFVDIMDMSLEKAYIFTNKGNTEISKYLEEAARVENKIETGTVCNAVLDAYLVPFHKVNSYMPQFRVTGEYFKPITVDILSSVTSPVQVLISWAQAKMDYVEIYADTMANTDKSFVVSSPNITGYREVALTPINDIVRRAVPKVLGFKNYKGVAK